MAMVACVALFEELSAGWKAAASVFEESLAFTLPGISLTTFLPAPFVHLGRMELEMILA